MLYEDIFVVKVSIRKTPRFKGETLSKKYFRCLCTSCGIDRGFITKSRFKAKPMCVKCATNTYEHRAKLTQNHRKTKGFQPWNKTDKSTMTRSSIVQQATPGWLTIDDKIAIRDMYRNCPAGYHVDHIMPLKGQTLSGLHVPWNLQWLPAKENRSKGNKVR